jgi:hypothetical protein
VIVSTSASTPASNDGELWTVRALLARHKLAALGVAAFIAVMLAIALVAVFGSKAGAISDATTCSEWGSANADQQAAYARLYAREHGVLRAGLTSPASVIAAINNGCSKAYTDDVSDTATVVQAISGTF